jgi:hypothetical protein
MRKNADATGIMAKARSILPDQIQYDYRFSLGATAVEE